MINLRRKYMCYVFRQNFNKRFCYVTIWINYVYDTITFDKYYGVHTEYLPL